MKFSQSLDLALHSLMIMACQKDQVPLMIKDLAITLNASESYLARVMLWLARAGILKSLRGKKGGFTFKIPPERITIADVVVAIDTDAGEYVCQGEERDCDKDGCAVVLLFREAREQMLKVLKRMTIADMAATRISAITERKGFVPESELLSLTCRGVTGKRETT